MTIKISTADARKNLSNIVNRVSFGKEPIILTRRGEEIAALVGMDELKLLQEIEDRIDIADAIKAIKEPGDDIPAEQFWKNLASKMTYTIKFRPAVEKNLRALPQKELIRIKKK